MSDPNVTPLLRYFFPAEILKSLQLTSNNECTIPDIRAKLYINSNGSIDDLLKFKSFPGSVNKFHRNMADPYMMDTYMYYGMNDADKPFFYKHDLLVYFEQFVFRRIRLLPFIIPAISFYFKCKEDELGSGRFELAPLNTDAIEKIEEQIERSIEKLHKHDKAIIREPFPEFSYQQFCARITKINFIDSSDLGPLPKILSENQAELSSDANKKLYPNIIIWIHTIVTVFNSITESHPELFRPSSVSRKPDDPVIIRCFEDDHKLYMMDFEFVLAKTPLVVSHQLKPIEDMKDAIKRSGVYETVFANQLKARLTKNREYVRHPILRTNRRAVPIPTFDGRHCILASDLLFEILRDMCSVQNVFQKINTKNWSIINNLFKDLAGTFNGKLGPFFIDTEKSEAVRKKCVTHIEQHLGPQLKEVKFIKEFNGFVLKDVKSTIKFLGLTTAFPKIADFAEHAFKTVKQRKGEKKLDTRDMFTALEICQLNCILPKLPNLQKFVHNQGACLRNHLHCAKCLQAHPEPLTEPTLFKWVTAETPGATVVARKCDAPDPEGFSESSESELPAELLAELKAKYPEHFPAANVEQVENEEKELQEESNETSPESRKEEPEKEESLEESSEEPSEKPVESILNKHSASCPNSSSQASTEEDKENIPASNPQEEGSSDCEQCENLRKFRDAMKELIGNCMSGTTEILKETRKDHKELENSLKSYGPIRLSDDNRELFDKQFERIMKRSDWDITNCGDDIRPWPWYVRPELKTITSAPLFFPAEILKSLQLTPNGYTIPDIRRKLYMNSIGTIDNLAKFKSFPGSDNKFEIGMTVPYNMDTYVYSSMTDADKTFAYKHDFLIFLGQIVSEKVKHSPLFMSLITFYLKNKERELGNGNFELALVDGDVLRQVQGRLDEAFGKLPEISREQFCGRMADMLKSRHDQDIKPLMDVFKEYENQIASLVSQNIYGEYCVWTGTIVEILNEFIGSHPEIFKPSSISKPIDEPDIIRCFVNDETMLIMDYEFELAKTQNRKLAYYELKDLKEMREKIIKTGVYETVMSHKFGTYFLKNAEFVRMSMIQTFRRAVPIPTFDGRHCILASDLLMEIFRDMCSVQNVFQKINQNNWSIVEDCFNDLAGTFNERLGPFFIDTEKSESVRKQCEDYFEKHLGSSRVDMINEVPETGFTLKDVEQNVKYLGLENAFPNIMKFADYAYTIMKKLSGNRTLETSDMLTVLEFCQVNCILPKLPKIERFIHNQGACRRVFYQCSYCLPIMPRALGNPKMRIWVRSRTQEMSKSYFAPNTEDVEQVNRNPEAEKGSSDKRESSEFPKDEKCENFEEFEEELQELIRYYAYEKERTSSKWGKNNRILEKSMKKFGPHELSEENRELFNKQFDRIMNRSDWDIKNCQPDDEGRPWPWFTDKEHKNH